MKNLNKQRQFLIILSVSVSALMNVNAQDNNYWNMMPGSRSALMGGAVVGGVRDNSAVFYNPGALGFVDTNTISVSASAYQYESETIKNGGGAGVTFKEASGGLIEPIPLIFISAIIKPKKNSKSSFGAMVFTKNSTANNFSNRVDGLKNDSILAGDGYASPNPNMEYIGEYNLKTTLLEIQAGLCYSYQINRHISIGLSPFIAYRSQTLASSFLSRVFTDSTSNLYTQNVTSIDYDDIENITFSNIRAYGKFGIALDYGNLKIGATFTSPSVNLFGSAIIERDISYNGVEDAPEIGVPTSYNYNDRQQHIKTTYKSPYSASLGIDYQIKKTKTTLAITGEYFGAIAPYNLATPADSSFQRPVWYNKNRSFIPISSDLYLRIREASQSVANYAIAIHQEISKKIDIVGSFRTDFTAYKKAANDFWEYQNVDQALPPGLRLSFSNINLYHATLGVVIKNKKSDIYLGVNYSFGTNKSFQPLNNIANPGDNTNNLGAVAAMYSQQSLAAFSNGSNPTGQLATYKYAAYSLILGYTHHFK
jgi:hypothetical protein